MVVRCFARRAVVPVRRQGYKGLSTSSLVRQEQIVEQESSPITVQKPSELKPDFFSSKTQVSRAFLRQAREANKPSAFAGASEAVHPLVKELLAALNNEEKTPSPDYIWNLFYSIHLQASPDGSNSSDSSQLLSAWAHHLVLKVISQKPKRQKLREELDDSVVSYRYRGALLSGSRKAAPDHTASYFQRVLFIFSRLRQCENEDLPSIKDYDVVLERLAPGGNMPALTALWAHLTGITSDDFSKGKGIQRLFHVGNNHRPTARTYMHFMMGISRHLSAQIQRIHKQTISNDIWKGQGRRRERKEKASSVAASKGQARYGQEVSSQARNAVRLASARTVALLEDMIERRIKPEKITVDLAMRTLRMDGNLGGIKVLLKVFGIDLENPDADSRTQPGEERERFGTDVHTLNTIIMAFGEQATVSEMLTAYETLTRPLPIKDGVIGEGLGQVRPVEEGDEMQTQGNLFATDWRGIFQRGVEGAPGEEGKENSSLDAEAEAEAIVHEVAHCEHPQAILPNTTTLTVMIKHCCNAPDPARMVAGEQAVGTSKALIKQEDHVARDEGDYLGVACYLLSEAVDIQERDTTRMCHQLGVEMPSVQVLCGKIETLLQECQGDLTTPGEMDKESFFEKILEESRETLSSPKLAEDFVPHYLPPALAVNYDMIAPIVKIVSRQRTANIPRWRWVIAQTNRAMAIKLAELQVIHHAIDKWKQVGEATDYEPNLSNESLKTLLTALRKQRRMIRTEILMLGTNMIDRMLDRFAALTWRRRRRQKARFARREEERELLLQSQAEDKEKRGRAALLKQQQREEEAEEREQMIPQEANVISAVEPVYK